MLAPYRFFDIPGQERNKVKKSGDLGTSKSNEMEARSCVSLVSFLCSQAPDYNVHHITNAHINLIVLVCRQDWYCDSVQGTTPDSSS